MGGLSSAVADILITELVLETSQLIGGTINMSENMRKEYVNRLRGLVNAEDEETFEREYYKLKDFIEKQADAHSTDKPDPNSHNKMICSHGNVLRINFG